MKARMILTDDKQTLILSGDGTICNANNSNRFVFLTSFSGDLSFIDCTDIRWDLEYPDMALYPGKTLAYIADNDQLVISDFSPFLRFISEETNMEQYISSIEYAKLHGVTYEMIKLYCRENRIPGAKKIARNWLIPKNAPYPIEPSSRRGSKK